MKFAVLIDEIRFGGVEKVAIEEVKALNDIGHEAVLLVLRKTASRAYSDILSDVKRIYFSDFLPRPLRFSFRLPFFRFFSLFHITYAFFIRFVPIKTRFDVVISHGTFTCFSGLMLARAKSTPCIAYVWDPVLHILRSVYLRPESLHNSFLSSIAFSMGASLDRWICRNASRVLASSSHHILYLLSLVTDANRVKPLPPGVRTSGHVRVHRENYVVLATAWKEGKDPRYVIELARRVAGLKFVLAGSWTSESMKDLFLSQVAGLDVDDRIAVTGSVEEKRLLELYSRALVFLQIKADVGFGLPALEAAAQGCTFIIPRGQGACDLFTNGREGFIVDEKDTDEIVRLLSCLSANPEVALTMGWNAWSTSQAFSWRRHAEGLSRIALEPY